MQQNNKEGSPYSMVQQGECLIAINKLYVKPGFHMIARIAVDATIAQIYDQHLTAILASFGFHMIAGIAQN